MYTIRAALAADEYALFESLTTDGVYVLKHPRSGRPSKKKFFLSLVQGESYLYMYLTWKGKQGTQGIELAAVTEVLSGIQTDVLRKSGKPQHAERYLSLVLPDRSLDLCYEGSAERARWQRCLGALVEMEGAARAASDGERAPQAAVEARRRRRRRQVRGAQDELLRAQQEWKDAAASSAPAAEEACRAPRCRARSRRAARSRCPELLRKLTDQQGATDTISRMNSQMLGEGLRMRQGGKRGAHRRPRAGAPATSRPRGTSPSRARAPFEFDREPYLRTSRARARFPQVFQRGGGGRVFGHTKAGGDHNNTLSLIRRGSLSRREHGREHGREQSKPNRLEYAGEHS